MGAVTPGVELLGVYNGNDENGTIFGDADLTLGRPIVAVRLTGVEDATEAYAALTTDKYVDVVSLTNQYIIANMRDYWQQVSNLNVPYHFFVADWDVEQTVVAYATDANGAEGGVGALAVKPVEYGDINELKDYVAAVNAAPVAMPQSLVVNNVAEPTIECIWSEEVGAPRAGFVKHHEVEPLPVAESDIIAVEVIKSFAL